MTANPQDPQDPEARHARAFGFMEDTMKTVCWEFPDGSSSEFECDDDYAHDEGMAICAAFPSARVWVGGEIVQRGFIAADEG